MKSKKSINLIYLHIWNQMWVKSSIYSESMCIPQIPIFFSFSLLMLSGANANHQIQPSISSNIFLCIHKTCDSQNNYDERKGKMRFSFSRNPLGSQSWVTKQNQSPPSHPPLKICFLVIFFPFLLSLFGFKGYIHNSQGHILTHQTSWFSLPHWWHYSLRIHNSTNH